MSKTAVVTGTFEVLWDVDEFRETWGEPDMSDEAVAAECLDAVRESPQDFLNNLVHLEVALA